MAVPCLFDWGLGLRILIAIGIRESDVLLGFAMEKNRKS